MIDYSKCALYKIESKDKLLKLLFIEKDKLYLLINNYNVYIRNKKRIIEECKPNLKLVHSRIFYLLKKLDLPQYLYSKKGIAYYDNYKPHSSNDYFYMLDIEKFFPKSSSYFVYQMFLEKFKMSSDVAQLITKICTIDKEQVYLNDEVLEWYERIEKAIRFTIPQRHIPTGSPISQLLAFIAFEDMFNEIEEYCKKKNLSFSVFVDDLTISSNKPISKRVIYDIKHILTNYNHYNNANKNRYRKKGENKRITGVILDKVNKPKAQMKTHKNFKCELEEFKTTNRTKHKNKLIGYINTINLIENKKYNNLKKKVKENNL